MEEIDIQQRFHLLEKQIEAAVSLFQDTKLDLLSAIETLRIEIETLKIFLERRNPELKSLYSQLKDEAVEKMNPEKKD